MSTETDLLYLYTQNPYTVLKCYRFHWFTVSATVPAMITAEKVAKDAESYKIVKTVVL